MAKVRCHPFMARFLPHQTFHEAAGSTVQCHRCWWQDLALLMPLSALGARGLQCLLILLLEVVAVATLPRASFHTCKVLGRDQDADCL